MPSELNEKIILIAARLGHVGADRESFFHHIRGIRYSDLEKVLLSLEREGCITIEWVGPSNFTVFITPKGIELAESYQENFRLESAETMGVEEPIAPSEEGAERLEDHVKVEREASSEEAMLGDIGIPSAEKVVKDEVVNMKEPEEKRHASNRNKKKVIIKAKKIPPPPPENLPEGSVEEMKIAENKAQKNEKVFEKAKSIPPAPEEFGVDATSASLSTETESILSLEESVQPEAETLPMATTYEVRCLWEINRDCPILRSKQAGADIVLTPNHCIACQLVKIKHLLKK